MFFTIFGAAMVISASASFWYLLPRNGQVNPLVRNSDIGSMVTIAIMSMLTIGVCVMFEGLFGTGPF
jgi:hypothetical protein